MFVCEAVDLDFLDTAPIRLRTVVNIGRPPREVFVAVAHDPANWGEFFPGFDKSGRWQTPEPHGVGSRYTKRFVGVTIEESVLIWDEGARLAFRVVGTTAPVFRAWVEDYHFESDGKGGTVLRVAIGGNGRLLFKLAAPVLPRLLAPLMGRMGRNIERGRWFSNPRST